MTNNNRWQLTGWFMWLLAAIFYALDYFQHTAPSVLIRPIAQSLQVNIVTIGDIMSIYFPIYAISQIPAGYIIDKFGLRRSLSSACLVTSVGLLSMTVPSQFMLVIGRSLIAFGSAFAFLGALKTADFWLSSRVFPIVVGLTNTIGVMGGILGQPFLEKLILVYQWQTAVLFISIFGFILAVILILFLHAPRKIVVQEALFSKERLAVLKDGNIWILGLYAGIMVGTVVNAFSELYDVVFLQDVFQFSAQDSAVISSMVFVGIAVGGPSHGVIGRWFRDVKQWMLLACALTILSFFGIVILANFSPHIYILYGLYFSSGFFVSSMLLSFAVAKIGYHESYHATVFALINMIIGVCGFIFQLALGEMILQLGHLFHGRSYHSIFLSSLIGLLIPLSISFILCSQIKKVTCDKKNIT